jgi:hypothetical protein
MTRGIRLIATITLVLSLSAAVGSALIMLEHYSASADARHTLLHINCKHHAHGTPWHDGHARAILDARAARVRAKAAASDHRRDTAVAPASRVEQEAPRRE